MDPVQIQLVRCSIQTRLCRPMVQVQGLCTILGPLRTSSPFTPFPFNHLVSSSLCKCFGNYECIGCQCAWYDQCAWSTTRHLETSRNRFHHGTIQSITHERCGWRFRIKWRSGIVRLKKESARLLLRWGLTLNIPRSYLEVPETDVCHVLSLAGMGAHVSSVIQVLLTHFGSSAIEPKGGIWFARPSLPSYWASGGVTW